MHYDKYNRKYGKDGIHKPLEWPELEQEIETFKHEHIFSNIIRKELNKNSMFVWLTRMCICHFGVLDPKYMRGAYTGVGRANYLVETANGTYKNTSLKVNLSFIWFSILLTYSLNVFLIVCVFFKENNGSSDDELNDELLGN